MLALYLLLLSLPLCCLSFSPPSPPLLPTHLPATPSFAGGMVGGEGPEPNGVNFDPLGLADKSPEWLPWFREAELKHGRAAMLATVGFVVPDFVRVPGEQFSFSSVPNVLDAHDALSASLLQILLFASLFEVCTVPALANMGGFDRRPGDFSFDPLGLYPDEKEKQEQMQLKELKNGRLAMIAIGGMVTQSTVTHHGFPYLF
ncbi:hypothetical protein TeGR_g492 [Tetraparma gracilis]|uniref:Uncharacterized protein n=1 Tax=Tetraparma gracilis TaxID=2962635 RepID=A0ABQ6M7M3_9STRA|nr:hypothetical protein TeGR_g492 [Tetraparma gracilis]